MENNPLINNFDAMIKQSLEGAQMPVPTGVWEAVGSSIGTKAVVAAKVTTIKLLILKAVAALVVAGGITFGVYELLSSDEKADTKIVKETPLVSNTETENVSGSEIPFTNSADDNSTAVISKDSVNYNRIKVSDSNPVVVIDTIKDILNPVQPNGGEKNDETGSPNIITGKPVTTTETPKTTEPSPKKENPVAPAKTETPKAEPRYSANDIFIPDVFTPYDIDGMNDCFKVLIETEVKFVLQIYNTENKIVFETTDKNNCWDGKNMNTGQMSPKGFYVIKLNYELKSGYKRTRTEQLNLY